MLGEPVVVAVALLTLRRRPVGNALILAGVGVAAAGSALAGLGEAGTAAFIAAAVVLPYSPVGGWFGFVPLPPAFLLALAIIEACYLLLAECAKRWFYRRHPPRGPRYRVLTA